MARPGQAAGLSGDEGRLARLREEIVRYAHRSYERGLVPGVSGNLSIRLPGEELLLISATGTSFLDLRVEEVLLVDFDQRVLLGEGSPSKEVRWHIGVYRAREDAQAILHVHPPAVTAYAAAGVIPPLATGAARFFLKRLAMVPVAPSGSAELAESMVRCLRADPEVRVVLMQEHGIAAVGTSMREAYFLADYAEDNARVSLSAGQIRTGGG